MRLIQGGALIRGAPNRRQEGGGLPQRLVKEIFDHTSVVTEFVAQSETTLVNEFFDHTLWSKNYLATL